MLWRGASPFPRSEHRLMVWSAALRHARLLGWRAPKGKTDQREHMPAYCLLIQPAKENIPFEDHPLKLGRYRED